MRFLSTMIVGLLGFGALLLWWISPLIDSAIWRPETKTFVFLVCCVAGSCFICWLGSIALNKDVEEELKNK